MEQLEIDKICRLCCEKKGRMHFLFEQRPNYPLPLWQIISEVSRLQVGPEDGMPQKICKGCTNTLLKIHETIENYRANDLKLRAQLRPLALVEIKQEEEEIDLDLLENALMQDLEVGDITLKQEPERGVPDQPNEPVSAPEDHPDNDNIEEETATDNEDDEWKPTEDDAKDEEFLEGTNDLGKVPLNQRKKKKKKELPEKKPRGKPGRKPKNENLGRRDPNRPRRHDHKCYICKSESQGSSEALIAHLNSSHLDLLPFTCPECVMETVVIKTVQRLNEHKRQHLNPEKCPHCDKRYTDKNSVAFHVAMNHDVDNLCPSTCELCGKEFPTKSSLNYHMQLHTNAAGCEFCGKVFLERRKLRLHVQRRHEKLKKYECNICKKKLASLDSVKTHMKTYHTNQEFKCTYCSRKFTSELSFRAHEKKHIENPDYVATKDWSEHYTVVEGEQNKPGASLKKCNLCGFVDTNMWIHLSKVHFPTEYRCHICDTTFNRKQSYKDHMARHEGKETCPICFREVTDRKNLIAHLRTKQHRDHPLAQSLDWLGYNPNKAKPKKKANDDTLQQKYEEIEVLMDDSL